MNIIKSLNEILDEISTWENNPTDIDGDSLLLRIIEKLLRDYQKLKDLGKIK